MYCKLFASLYQGTLRGHSDEILVFTNLLAHCDRAGYIDKHFRAIADEVGISVDRVKQAILNLEAPDDESRSKEESGSRLIRMDDHRVWGWQVVNYAKYRAIRNEEDRREQTRAAVARHRAKKKSNATVTDVNVCKPSVNNVSHVSHGKPRKAHAEAEAEAEAENIYCSYPRKVGKKKALESIRRALKTESPEHLLGRTKAFAASPAGNRGKYTPHPATWFGQERYNDDPAEWQDKEIQPKHDGIL